MKKLILFISIYVAIVSCNNQEKKPAVTNPEITISETAGYFPVTSYIMGQIAEIKSDGISPLRIITTGKKSDSAWVKPELLDSLFAGFLTPAIDSANMISLFKETTFHDQTLNSITFTYEPLKELPATMPLRRWDVYVTPQTGAVRSIYMEKYTTDKKEIKLTWQSNGSSKIVYVVTDAAGNSTIEKEELVKWNFDEE